MKEADCSSNQLELFGRCVQPQADGSQVSMFGKMCQGRFLLTRAGTFLLSSRPSRRPLFQCLNLESGQTQEWSEAEGVILHGGSSMHNIGESPSVARESSLSQILEPYQNVDRKYFLSAKACKGILRRAEKRGKELPAPLLNALRYQITLSEGTQETVETD